MLLHDHLKSCSYVNFVSLLKCAQALEQKVMALDESAQAAAYQRVWSVGAYEFRIEDLMAEIEVRVFIFGVLLCIDACMKAASALHARREHVEIIFLPSCREGACKLLCLNYIFG